jgi:hypothetical protein
MPEQQTAPVRKAERKILAPAPEFKSCPNVSILPQYTVTRIDGKLHQLHRVAQTKQSG